METTAGDVLVEPTPVEITPGEQDAKFFGDLDMVACAREVLRLLSTLDKRSELGESAYLRKVKLRYLKFINLVHKNPEAHLTPSDEVEGFWQSHLIRPDMYERDCMKLFGHIIPHHVEYRESRILEGRENAKKLWDSEYGEDIDVEDVSVPEDLRALFESVEIKQLDIIEDRQWLIYYRMYTYMVRDWDKYLAKSRDLYQQFLRVAGNYKGGSWLEPTYAMDLLWHCHMMHPLEYQAKCKELANRLLVHVPWPKDLTEKQMFDNLDAMNDRWKDQFGVEMHFNC